jgi:hypothetical protein
MPKTLVKNNKRIKRSSRKRVLQQQKKKKKKKLLISQRTFLELDDRIAPPEEQERLMKYSHDLS